QRLTEVRRSHRLWSRPSPGFQRAPKNNSRGRLSPSQMVAQPPAADPKCGAALSKGTHVNFFKGQVVIHPHHGPATVNKISTRLMKENTTDYLKLEVHNPPLVVGVPVGRAEELGVRSTVDADDVREIFDVLVAPSDAAD